MSTPSTASHELAAEIAAIAIAADSLTARAQALLEPLHRLMPFDAAWISLLDPERHRQPPLIRHGYDARVQQYLDGAQYMDDLEQFGMHGSHTPMRIKDLPAPPCEIAGWATYFLPAGFGEGVSVPLTTPDGRYLGLFAATTETRTAPSDDVRDQLARLAPLIAHAVDPMRALTALAALVTAATAGVVLTRGGNTATLTGLPEHPLLRCGSAVVAEAIACLQKGDQLAEFLTGREGPEGYLKVTVLGCPQPPAAYLRAVVLLAPPGDLHGLTHRDLCILGMLIAGWPHQRIAATQQVALHTLITTIDEIRAKLGAPTRDAAVIRAADQGLHLPPPATCTNL
ncbi:hypothetical protein [Actinoplanes sp. NPDC049681]|uniref:hypothetical protein n=1 Tax=Actinoplanes sp. NPDC049681 TaxID=3363905 RepID=UPI003794E1B1